MGRVYPLIWVCHWKMCLQVVFPVHFSIKLFDLILSGLFTILFWHLRHCMLLLFLFMKFLLAVCWYLPLFCLFWFCSLNTATHNSICFMCFYYIACIHTSKSKRRLLAKCNASRRQIVQFMSNKGVWNLHGKVEYISQKTVVVPYLRTGHDSINMLFFQIYLHIRFVMW